MILRCTWVRPVMLLGDYISITMQKVAHTIPRLDGRLLCNTVRSSLPMPKVVLVKQK